MSYTEQLRAKAAESGGAQGRGMRSDDPDAESWDDIENRVSKEVNEAYSAIAYNAFAVKLKWTLPGNDAVEVASLGKNYDLDCLKIQRMAADSETIRIAAAEGYFALPTTIPFDAEVFKNNDAGREVMRALLFDLLTYMIGTSSIEDVTYHFDAIRDAFINHVDISGRKDTMDSMQYMRTYSPADGKTDHLVRMQPAIEEGSIV